MLPEPKSPRLPLKVLSPPHPSSMSDAILQAHSHPSSPPSPRFVWAPASFAEAGPPARASALAPASPPARAPSSPAASFLRGPEPSYVPPTTLSASGFQLAPHSSSAASSDWEDRLRRLRAGESSSRVGEVAPVAPVAGRGAVAAAGSADWNFKVREPFRSELPMSTFSQGGGAPSSSLALFVLLNRAVNISSEAAPSDACFYARYFLEFLPPSHGLLASWRVAFSADSAFDQHDVNPSKLIAAARDSSTASSSAGPSPLLVPISSGHHTNLCSATSSSDLPHNEILSVRFDHQSSFSVSPSIFSASPAEHAMLGVSTDATTPQWVPMLQGLSLSVQLFCRRGPVPFSVSHSSDLSLQTQRVTQAERRTLTPLPSDELVGTSRVDLAMLWGSCSATSEVFARVEGWYHLVDARGAIKGQVQLAVWPSPTLAAAIRSAFPLRPAQADSASARKDLFCSGLSPASDSSLLSSIGFCRPPAAESLDSQLQQHLSESCRESLEQQRESLELPRKVWRESYGGADKAVTSSVSSPVRSQVVATLVSRATQADFVGHSGLDLPSNGVQAGHHAHRTAGTQSREGCDGLNEDEFSPRGSIRSLHKDANQKSPRSELSYRLASPVSESPRNNWRGRHAATSCDLLASYSPSAANELPVSSDVLLASLRTQLSDLNTLTLRLSESLHISSTKSSSQDDNCGPVSPHVLSPYDGSAGLSQRFAKATVSAGQSARVAVSAIKANLPLCAEHIYSSRELTSSDAKVVPPVGTLAPSVSQRNATTEWKISNLNSPLSTRVPLSASAVASVVFPGASFPIDSPSKRHFVAPVFTAAPSPSLGESFRAATKDGIAGSHPQSVGSKLEALSPAGSKLTETSPLSAGVPLRAPISQSIRLPTSPRSRLDFDILDHGDFVDIATRVTDPDPAPSTVASAVPSSPSHVQAPSELAQHTTSGAIVGSPPVVAPTTPRCSGEAHGVTHGDRGILFEVRGVADAPVSENVGLPLVNAESQNVFDTLSVPAAKSSRTVVLNMHDVASRATSSVALHEYSSPESARVLAMDGHDNVPMDESRSAVPLSPRSPHTPTRSPMPRSPIAGQTQSVLPPLSPRSPRSRPSVRVQSPSSPPRHAVHELAADPNTDYRPLPDPLPHEARSLRASLFPHTLRPLDAKTMSDLPPPYPASLPSGSDAFSNRERPHADSDTVVRTATQLPVSPRSLRAACPAPPRGTSPIRAGSPIDNLLSSASDRVQPSNARNSSFRTSHAFASPSATRFSDTEVYPHSWISTDRESTSASSAKKSATLSHSEWREDFKNRQTEAERLRQYARILQARSYSDPSTSPPHHPNSSAYGRYVYDTSDSEET